MSRWITALLILAVGAWAGGGAAARAATLAEMLAGAPTPVPAQHAKPSARSQKTAKPRDHPGHPLAHDSKPLARDPQPAALAKTPPADPAIRIPTEGPAEALKPYSVRPIAIVPPVASPVAPPPDVNDTPGPEVDEIRQPMPALTADDLVAINAIRPAQIPARGSTPSTPIDVLMLIVLCALVTTNARGQIPRIGFVASDGRGGARSPQSGIDPIPRPRTGDPIGDTGPGRIEWLLPTPGGRTVGDGFAYAFAHHWTSIWNCRYTSLPAGAVTFPIGRRSLIGDGFELPELQIRSGATNQDQILDFVTAGSKTSR